MILQYDTIEKFNVDSEAEYLALSSTRSHKKYKKEETKTKKRQCPFNSVQIKIVKAVQEEKEWLWTFVKEMNFKSGVKGRGSDRWWERRWWLWWGDMCRMPWTRRRVNRMRLTEWRRELIPQVRWCICERYKPNDSWRRLQFMTQDKPFVVVNACCLIDKFTRAWTEAGILLNLRLFTNAENNCTIADNCGRLNRKHRQRFV